MGERKGNVFILKDVSVQVPSCLSVNQSLLLQSSPPASEMQVANILENGTIRSKCSF